MYDLRVGPIDAPEIAIECVGAVDSVFTETWNAGPAKGALTMSVQSNWTVDASADVRIKTLRRNLEPLLKKLESQQLIDVRADYRLERSNPVLFAEFEALKITHVHCHTQDGTEQVHLGLPGIGGAVDYTGGEVAQWVSDFLHNPAYRDVPQKLQRSGAKNCHAFVIVGFHGAPWPVESYLAERIHQLPSEAPTLPSPITGVWIISDLGRQGVR